MKIECRLSGIPKRGNLKNLFIAISSRHVISAQMMTAIIAPLVPIQLGLHDAQSLLHIAANIDTLMATDTAERLK
jgi:hypothetical protein